MAFERQSKSFHLMSPRQLTLEPLLRAGILAKTAVSLAAWLASAAVGEEIFFCASSKF
jgi:hypothetical protein